MKKQLLLCGFLITAALANAQSKTTVGFKAGITSASIQGDASESFKNLIDYTNGSLTTNSKTGFFGGVNVNIPVTEKFSIEPGLYYSQKGYELKGELNIKGAEFLSPNAKATLNSHYIDLPILAKGNFSGFQVFAGPQISYLADADLKVTAGAMGFNFYKRTMDAKDQLNEFDASIIGGVGYQLSKGINITAMYDHGLMKTDANKNMDAYNRSFKVGVGINF